jgi:hypothetical protein
LVFGLLQLIGFQYRPALADIPDQRLWRANGHADYGPSMSLPAAGSTWPGSARTGLTSCGWSALSTPAPRVPMTSCGCSSGTGTPPHWGGDRLLWSGLQLTDLLALIDDEAYRRDIKYPLRSVGEALNQY